MSVDRWAAAAGLIVAVAVLGVVAGVSSGCGAGGDAPQFEVSVQFTTEAAGFCQTVETELGAKSYVDEVSCGPQVETGQADPDEPVSTDND